MTEGFRMHFCYFYVRKVLFTSKTMIRYLHLYDEKFILNIEYKLITTYPKVSCIIAYCFPLTFE